MERRLDAWDLRLLAIRTQTERSMLGVGKERQVTSPRISSGPGLGAGRPRTCRTSTLDQAVRKMLPISLSCKHNFHDRPDDDLLHLGPRRIRRSEDARSNDDSSYRRIMATICSGPTSRPRMRNEKGRLKETLRFNGGTPSAGFQPMAISARRGTQVAGPILLIRTIGRGVRGQSRGTKP